jgi:3-hydroxyisobutyrate dehydrogenase-like beta-hydroxyacid dehydrogenase
MTTTDRVAFLGLGVMGFPMAGHVADSGRPLAVWNRTPERAQQWLDAHPGARVAATPAEAASGASVVLTCVSDGAAVREVLLGAAGAASVLEPGAVVVDHSTISAHDAREIAAVLRERGIGFLDAPVSGGEAGAVNGRLTVMAGGAADDFALVDPVVAAYGATRRLLGDVGAGQLAKMVNQICIAGVVQGLAEAVAFAQCTGQDVEAVFETIGAGAAGSWQLANRSATMARGEFEFGFAVEHMRKDLGFCLEEARSAGAALPVTALVDQFYAEVVADGGRRWDTSSLISRLPRPAAG